MEMISQILNLIAKIFFYMYVFEKVMGDEQYYMKKTNKHVHIILIHYWKEE